MQILTRNGFKDFEGIICNGVRPIVDLGEEYSNLKCTPEHRIKINGEWVTAETISDVIVGNELVYDAVNVADGNEYITNANDSHNCLLLDEFAFIPTNQAQSFFDSVYPTITSGKSSKISIFSTPNGMNHFHKMWRDATDGTIVDGKHIKSDFSPVRISWDEVPGRDEEFRKNTIATVGLESWLQEYECEFHGATGTLIPSSVIRNLNIAQPKSAHPHMRVYDDPAPERTYIITCDVARGAGGDYSVASVFDITELPYKQVAVYRNNTISYLLFPGVVYGLAKKYNDAYVLIELNDNGESVADDLYYNYQYDNILTTGGTKGKIVLGAWTNSKNGLRTTKSTKRQGCSLLKALLENGELIINDYDTIEEMSKFVSKGGSYEAEPGATDDIMMTLVIFAWGSSQEYFKELTNSDFKKKLIEQSQESIYQDLSPIGFLSDMDDGETWNL